MNIKEQVKELWKLCFDDTDEFIEMYFKRCYSDDNNLFLLDKGNVISALQMIPFPMTFCGGEINTSYISGACTHPVERGKGAMEKLLLQSLRRMKQQNILFSSLIPAEPWLFDYYNRMGYAGIFNYSERRVPIPNVTPSREWQVHNHTEPNKELYSYLAGKMSERSCCIQHTRLNYQAVIEDVVLSGGNLLSIHQKDKIAGVAFVLPSTGTITVTELFSENKEAANRLLHQAGHLSGQSEAVIISPVGVGDTSLPLGMGRIVDALGILQLYAAANPELAMKFELTDGQLPENNGFYTLEKGKCRKEQGDLHINNTRMSISELTREVFTPQNPYMSLMLN